MTSVSFPIHQDVRQDAVLSPLLYSTFVDELLDLLSTSGLGVRVNTIYCGASMYADDLALNKNLLQTPAETLCSLMQAVQLPECEQVICHGL